MTCAHLWSTYNLYTNKMWGLENVGVGQNRHPSKAEHGDCIIHSAAIGRCLMLGDLKNLVSLCKRRGFVFQSSEIYGGMAACWDYGPLGVELKRNIKALWWREMCQHEDVVGLDAAILMHPDTWKASGHIDGFTDPLVDCKKCKHRFRPVAAEGGPKVPRVVEGEGALAVSARGETQGKNGVSCPECGSRDLTTPRQFNLMFKTQAGPVEGEGSQVYLRPETAQGIFVQFENIYKSMRQKIPFGVAQIGKAFRNEITPGNFIFRTREFEQMEMQYFIHPSAENKAFDVWQQRRQKFYSLLNIAEQNLRIHPHLKNELAHYARKAVDIEYQFPFGWQELEGIHNRSDFDLKQHQALSGKKLEYFDPTSNTTFVPYVIETSAGCDRMLLALLCEAYSEQKVKDETRTVLQFPHRLAPVEVAVLPLSKKPQLQNLARQVLDTLRPHYRVQYDEAQSIGKRYRRQDEIGTPFCLTVDFESLDDNKITCRHRDSMQQDRIDISQASLYLTQHLKQV